VTAVLLVASITEQCHANDLALNFLVENASVANNIVHDGSTLRVTSGNEDFAAGCLCESLSPLVDAGLVGALRANVGRKGGSVADWVGLHAGEKALKSRFQTGSDEDALLEMVGELCVGYDARKPKLTIGDGSVDPRAKTNPTLHP
jgi:hypothetical protein